MPIGLIRAAFTVMMVALLAGACSNSDPAGPEGADVIRGVDGRAVGPAGLEQRLVTSVEAPPPGSPYTRTLVVTSTLTNTGSAPVRAEVRVCFFKESDFTTTARLDRFEPTISCAAESMELDLRPGESTEPMEVVFGVLSGPGEYTIQLRHALTPEFRAEARFRIP